MEVGGFVDGPGIRFVVFLSGCPLRCQYCHSPDAWESTSDRVDSANVLAEIAKAAELLESGHGGVTLSGGEPLAQAQFALEILQGSKALGLHTALDTSGYLGDQTTDEMLESVDLVLLDIKSYDADIYGELTGVDVAPTLRFAERLSDIGKATWVRFVLVPGLTDDPDNVTGLAHFLGGLSNVERVEVVPFHQMGQRTWRELGIPYPLEGTVPPTADAVRRAQSAFRAEGLNVDGGRFVACSPSIRGV